MKRSPMKRGKPLRRSRWPRKISPQTRRTRAKRWGPPGYVEFVKSYLGGKCAILGCENTRIDAAHVFPRGRGGTWESNIVPLCRFHHRQYDERCGSDPTKFDWIHCVDLPRLADEIWLDWNAVHPEAAQCR